MSRKIALMWRMGKKTGAAKVDKKRTVKGLF